MIVLSMPLGVLERTFGMGEDLGRHPVTTTIVMNRSRNATGYHSAEFVIKTHVDSLLQRFYDASQAPIERTPAAGLLT